jgi:hypothetical protein
MLDPLQLMFDFTENFYSTMGSLYLWFTDDIDLLGITFTPFDILFSWATLVIILGAVIFKKLVPLS